MAEHMGESLAPWRPPASCPSLPAEARRRLARRTHTGAAAIMARVRPLSASNSG